MTSASRSGTDHIDQWLLGRRKTGVDELRALGDPVVPRQLIEARTSVGTCRYLTNQVLNVDGGI
jgi:hypothetical protein